MSLGRLILRGGLLATAGGVFFWCSYVLQASPDQGQAAQIADRIARGESYHRSVLTAATESMAAVADNTCDARYLIASTVIQAKIIELEFQQQDLGAIDVGMEQMFATSSRLVHCVPTASIGWLGLYWVKTLRDGFQPADLKLLAMSYQLGRRERWIEVRRNRLALAVYSQLSADLQGMALDELVDVIGFAELDQAVTQFVALEPAAQQRVLAMMSRVPISVSKGFYSELRHLGFENVPTFGHPRRPDEPWL